MTNTNATNFYFNRYQTTIRHIKYIKDLDIREAAIIGMRATIDNSADHELLTEEQWRTLQHELQTVYC